jgi:hypothetical protein
MIISEQPRFILFSMEKTGTSSMDDALSAHFDQPRYHARLVQSLPFSTRFRHALGRVVRGSACAQANDCWNAVPGLKHSSPRWIFGKRAALLAGNDWNSYFKACFVRNPLDRLLSVYSFHTQKLAHVYPQANAAGSLRNWLRMGGTGSATKSMKDFVTDGRGTLLVDFIGRYENLEADWREFLTRAGLGAVALPRSARTRTEHADWRDVWTAELFEIVLANPVWKADLEYFGYADTVRQALGLR